MDLGSQHALDGGHPLGVSLPCQAKPNEVNLEICNWHGCQGLAVFFCKHNLRAQHASSSRNNTSAWLQAMSSE
eukprot:2411442-Amphidinium_carterae.1